MDLLPLEIPEYACRIVPASMVPAEDRLESITKFAEALDIHSTRPNVKWCGEAVGETINFVVYGGGVVCGRFTLYEVERIEGNQYRAKPLPAFKSWLRGMSDRRAWGWAMNYALENDLPMSERETFDLVEWLFPLEEGHDWTEHEGEALAEVFEMLSGHPLVEKDGMPAKVTK